MANKKIRSRILEYFEPELLIDLYKVCKSSVVSDNNLKVNTMLNILKQYKKDYIELGPGTNRLAILIDNYVFKIALDKWGLRDNINEFTISQELQPYVTKTYETNELIAVSEYITVISREEFDDKKEEIQEILEILSSSYLLGDVGTVSKNFCNWGYRDNGELAILDFAYIFRVTGEEMLCTNCNLVLEYDENYNNLICPNCGKKYTFMDVRRKISMEQELKENFMVKQLSFKLTKPIMEIEVSEQEEKSSQNRNVNKEENQMSNYNEENYEDLNEAYLKELESMKHNQHSNKRETSVKKPQGNAIEITSNKVIEEIIPQTNNDMKIKYTKEEREIIEVEEIPKERNSTPRYAVKGIIPKIVFDKDAFEKKDENCNSNNVTIEVIRAKDDKKYNHSEGYSNNNNVNFGHSEGEYKPLVKDSNTCYYNNGENEEELTDITNYFNSAEGRESVIVSTTSVKECSEGDCNNEETLMEANTEEIINSSIITDETRVVSFDSVEDQLKNYKDDPVDLAESKKLISSIAPTAIKDVDEHFGERVFNGTKVNDDTDIDELRNELKNDLKLNASKEGCEDYHIIEDENYEKMYDEADRLKHTNKYNRKG